MFYFANSNPRNQHEALAYVTYNESTTHAYTFMLSTS